MRLLLKLLLILLLFGWNKNCLYAQKEGKDYIDSLLKEFPRFKEDTNKVLMLNDLSFNYYYYSIDSNNGIRYGIEGLRLAEKLGWKYGIGDANNVLGANYLAKSQPGKALEYFQKALADFEAINNQTRVARVLGNIGCLYSDQSDFPKAIEYDLKALGIFEKLHDNSGITKNLGNLGEVYISQGNYPVALEYNFRSLKINEELGVKTDIAANLTNIGNIYIATGNYAAAQAYNLKALKIDEEIGDNRLIIAANQNLGDICGYQKDYTNALTYYSKALHVSESISSVSDIAFNVGNIGYITEQQGKYAQALPYEFKALGMFQETGNKQHLAWDQQNIGITYLAIAKDTMGTVKTDSLIPAGKTANINKAITYLKNALALCKEIGNAGEMPKIIKPLSEALQLAGNYKDALETYKQYIIINDSLFSIENKKKIATLDATRETELKQKQIEVQNLQIMAAKNERKYYIAGLAAFVLLSAGLFGRFRAVRRHKKQSDALRERAERSEAFNKQFLANMSHEIRTPMNAVMGMTNLVLDTPLQAQQRLYVEGIKQSSDNLLHIINDILDLSKIEAGKMELEQIDFSLSDDVAQVKQTLMNRAEEKGLQLITNIDPAIPDVLIGDPVRLNQVLINLTGNAIKFTEKGSVLIDVKKVDGGVRFSIMDTGIGISKDKLQTVFENFSQANASDTRKYGGTGLGLSISRQLVGIMGGSISIESEVGSGTTFSFVIDLKEGDEGKLRQRLARDQQVDGSILDGLNILVVDDNEYNRIVAKDTLVAKSKAVVMSVGSAQEAFALLKEQRFDIVLMDLQMPDMNGFEATRYIRTNFEAPVKDIPIIALTASVLRADLDKCRQAGMDSYIAKPFKAGQLITGIAQALNIVIGPAKEGVKSTPDNTHTPVTDLAYLRQYCEGDEARVRNYITVYLKAAKEFENKAKTALDSKDNELIAALVHALKPKWKMMGMAQSMELGNKIELLCLEQGNESKITECIFMLVEQNDLSMKALEA